MNPTLANARFEDVLHGHIQALQESFLALSASIDADLLVPYPLSKRLEVDKNLTWKAARLVQAQDAYEALKHLPGNTGRELLFSGFRRAGAPEQAIREVAERIHALEAAVRSHTDDRETLELVLDGIPKSGGEILETSRKLAFRGNSGVFGVQARTRLTTTLLAPSRVDPNFVELVLVAGYHRIRRLRERTPWPILNLRRIGRDGDTSLPQTAEPLDPNGGTSIAPTLLERFSSPDLPTIRTIETPQVRTLELPSGPVGNPGALDIVFGERHRAFAPIWAEEADDHAEHQTDLELPVELLLFDLLVHKDVPLAQEPRFQLLGRLGRPLPPFGPERDLRSLPIHEEVVEFEHGGLAAPVKEFPRYDRVLAFTCERIGWDLDDFRVLRVTMAYPPVPSTAILSYPLARRR